LQFHLLIDRYSMTQDDTQNRTPSDEQLEFVEQIGLILEENDQPRIAGRIIGWLLICDPPHQSFDDLVGVLQVSKGSVSNMTRLMLQSGLIERVSLPGDRKTYFKIRNDAWKRTLERQLRLAHRLADAAGDGLDLMEEESLCCRERLEQLRDFMGFSARKIEEQIEEYEPVSTS
jgi:DNA-binding transcriptional regulator GbsR (MarR family)